MANVNFQLLRWQREVLNDKTRFKVVVAGRRCGKSRLAAVMLLLEGLNCPEGSGVMYIAPTQGQARVIIWNVLMQIGRDVIASAKRKPLPNWIIGFVEKESRKKASSQDGYVRDPNSR